MRPVVLLAVSVLFIGPASFASPPAVGMASNSKTCLSCHVSTGPWTEASSVVVDILDKATMASLKQPDGSFQITARRGQPTTVITVLGVQPAEKQPVPNRNGWIYVDTTLIGTPSVSKFASGWEADITYGCKIVGDKTMSHPEAAVTTAPLTVRPTESAKDADISLQILMTSGEVVKNKPKEGLLGNYHARTVRLRVTD